MYSSSLSQSQDKQENKNILYSVNLQQFKSQIENLDVYLFKVIEKSNLDGNQRHHVEAILEMSFYKEVLETINQTQLDLYILKEKDIIIVKINKIFQRIDSISLENLKKLLLDLLLKDMSQDKQLDQCIKIKESNITQKDLQVFYQLLMKNKLLHNIIKQNQNNYFIQNDQVVIYQEIKQIQKWFYLRTNKLRFLHQRDSEQIYLLFSKAIMLKSYLSISDIFQKVEDKEEIIQKISGISVFADYNPKEIYKIETVENYTEEKAQLQPKKSPKSKYLLLVSKLNSNREQRVYLNPDICYQVIEGNKKLKNILPPQEIKDQFAKNYFQSQDRIIQELKIDDNFEIEYIKCEIKQLKLPVLRFDGNSNTMWDPNQQNSFFGADKAHYIGYNIQLNNWVLIYNKGHAKLAYRFDRIVAKLADILGITLYGPKIIEIDTDNPQKWQQCLEQQFEDKETQPEFIVSLSSKQNSILDLLNESQQSHQLDDLKTILQEQIILKYQCIYQNINIDLINNEKTQEILMSFLQIICKLGYPLWTVQQMSSLATNTMVIGIETFNNYLVVNGKVQEIVSIVASTNNFQTTFFSQSYFRNVGDYQDIQKFKKIIKEAVREFNKNNNFPNNRNIQNIIVYRRYRDYQFEIQAQYEIQILSQIFEKPIKLYFINVKIDKEFQLLKQEINKYESYFKTPQAGIVFKNQNSFHIYTNTIKEDIIRYPTQFQDLTNEEVSKDIMQFSFNLCFNYYNVQGPIKLPAHLKYAKKLSQFSYELKKEILNPDYQNLSDKLFYL